MPISNNRNGLSVTYTPEFLKNFEGHVREVYCRNVNLWLTQRDDTVEASYGGQKDGDCPRWDGGKDQWGKTFPRIWPSLATLLLTEGLDPESYIPFHFRCGGSSRFPTPAELQYVKCVQQYRMADAPGRLRSRIRIQLLCDIKTFEAIMQERASRQGMGWTREQILISVIADEGLDLSPLYRFVLAAEACLGWLMDSLRMKALLQYMEAREQYNEVLPFNPFEVMVPKPKVALSLTAVGRVVEL